MRKILILGNNLDALKSLKAEIEKESFTVSVAQGADAALTILDHQTFDCVLSDFDLLNFSGPEFCRQVKSRKKLIYTPVVIIASRENEENHLTSLEAGADDYIPKDSDIRVIIAKIKAMIRIKDLRCELYMLRRLEGIKQIVAKYNHDFNNPLTIAVGNLIWLKNSCTTEDQTIRIERLGAALERMSGLVKRIRELRDYIDANDAEGKSKVESQTPLS